MRGNGSFGKTKRTGSTTHPFLIKLTNLTKPKLMKINVLQRYMPNGVCQKKSC